MRVTLAGRGRKTVAALATAAFVGSATIAMAHGYPSSGDDRTEPRAGAGNADTRSAQKDPAPFTGDEATAVAERLSQGPAHHVRVPDILAELGGDSFAGLRMEDGGRRIVSYWAGEIPLDAERYAASEPDGITIELVTSARYSRDQLTAAVERILNSDIARHADVSWASVQSDGSGLEIGLDGAEPTDAVKAEIAELASLPDSAIRYAPHSAFVNVPGTAASPPASEG